MDCADSNEDAAMRHAGFAILLAFFIPTQVWAAPTPVPAEPDIPALIAKLGDANFHVRSDASIALRELGDVALPALKAAERSDNPEIRVRATELADRLEFHHVPGRPANHDHTRTCNVSVSLETGKRSVDIDDEGRSIKIVQGDMGLTMSVTGEIDGRTATVTYRADSPEQLRRKNPEAYALYDRWKSAVSDEGDGFINGPAIVQNNVGQNIVVAPPMIAGPGGDDLTAFRAKVEDEMATNKLALDDKRKVREALDEVDQGRQLNTVPGMADGDERMQKYFKACDNLRTILSDLKLSDPGDTLPPPQNSRLGIVVYADDGTHPPSISHVVPNSRAEKLGLQEDDIIRKINGQEVNDYKMLRRVVSEHAKGLVFDITRDGRDMQLKE